MSSTEAKGIEGEAVAWHDEDYRRARDCMIDVLRNSHAWSITTDDLHNFDNAFQHAVGILSLTARLAASQPAAPGGEAVAFNAGENLRNVVDDVRGDIRLATIEEALHSPQMQAAGQEAIINHPFYNGGATAAYGFAGAVLMTVANAIRSLASKAQQ